MTFTPAPKPLNSRIYHLKQNKYRNIRQTYNGYSYMSKKEAQFAYELDMRLKAKEIVGWEKQKKIELFGEHGRHICNYFVDFIVSYPDGTEEYIDVKSPTTKTDVWRLKWKMLEDKLDGDCTKKMTVYE